MPLCVNRTFFTAWFLTSATAGGVNPSAAAPPSAFVSAHKNVSVDVFPPQSGIRVFLAAKWNVKFTKPASDQPVLLLPVNYIFIFAFKTSTE